MNQQSPLYTEILTRIGELRRKENRLVLHYNLLAGTALLAASLFTAILAEEILHLGVAARTVMAVVLMAAAAAVLAWFAVRPSLRVLGITASEDTPSIAGRIGQHFPAIRDRLLDALEMYEARETLQSRYSLELIDASFSDLFEQIQPLDFTSILSTSRIRRIGRVLLSAAILFALVFVISPGSFVGSAGRIISFGQSFAAPLPVRFVVEPGSIEVVRGQNVPLLIRTAGRPLKSISLLMRQEGQLDFEAISVARGTDGVFRFEISGIKSSTEYYASAEDVSSDRYRLTVLNRPLIRSLRVKVTAPPYTRIPPKALEENTGDISAYTGSRVSFELSASKDLSSAELVFSDSSRLALSEDRAAASGSFTVRKNLSYHFLLKDTDGLPNVDPIEYTIKVVPDAFPTAELLLPGRNLDLTDDLRVNLLVRIRDDFGFSRLRLAFRLTTSRYEKPAEEYSFIELPLASKDQPAQDVTYQWDLTGLRLVPEDVVAYYAEVFDNDNISGPKSGRSETYTLRLPSLEEVFSDVSQTHEQTLESMQNVAKETEQLRKDIDELQRDMQAKREKMDWQQQKKAEEMMQRYEAIKQHLGETTQKVDNMMKEMEQNHLLSQETLQKYTELQKLMEELNSPELLDALRKMQESMKQLTSQQPRQSLEQLKASEEMFRQSLERTIELLKRIHIEQKIDEVIKRAEELKAAQDKLGDETSKTDPSDSQKRDNLSKKQSDLHDQMQSLGEETKKLQQNMGEFPKEMPLEELSKAQKELEESGCEEGMQQASEQISSSDMQGAQKGQRKASASLDKFSKDMKAVQQSLRSKQMQQIIGEMRKQLQNLLKLSEREEDLRNGTGSLDPNSQRFRESAERQMESMNDLSNVAGAMTDIAKKSFAISPEMSKEIGNAMNQMAAALQSMEGRNPGGASGMQGEAMGSLNRAAMMLQNAMGNMMQNGQQGMGMAGLMSLLGQMTGAQGSINAGTQQAMGMGQGQGQNLTAQQMAEYQRLAGQQSGVKKSLEELANEAKNNGEYSRLLGDLDQVAKDMTEVQTDLAQGNVNPETVKKQERILSRMLDSQRSLRERDYEKRRRAEAGKTIYRATPADIDLSTQEGKNRLRQELLKVLEGKYSKDYEELIRRYFEQLEKEEIKQ